LEASEELFDLLNARSLDQEKLKMAVTLLEQGADANHHDEDETILCRAIRGRNADTRGELVRALINHGADVNQKEDIFSPLYFAIMRSDAGVVQSLIDGGANEALDDALRVAIERDQAAIVEMLIPKVKDINVDGERASSFLIACCEAFRLKGRQEQGSAPPGLATAHLLLDAGASPKGAPGQRDTPLEQAIAHDFSELAALLCERGADVTEDAHVHVAPNAKSTLDLVAAGAVVDARNERGETPLIALFMQEPDLPKAKALLDSGADPYAVDNEGLTAFHRAVLHESTELLDELLPLFDLGKCHQIVSLLDFCKRWDVSEEIDHYLKAQLGAHALRH
jgi:ankyrin repeat protein